MKPPYPSCCDLGGVGPEGREGCGCRRREGLANGRRVMRGAVKYGVGQSVVNRLWKLEGACNSTEWDSEW